MTGSRLLPGWKKRTTLSIADDHRIMWNQECLTTFSDVVNGHRLVDDCPLHSPGMRVCGSPPEARRSPPTDLKVFEQHIRGVPTVFREATPLLASFSFQQWPKRMLCLRGCRVNFFLGFATSGKDLKLCHPLPSCCSPSGLTWREHGTRPAGFYPGCF